MKVPTEWASVCSIWKLCTSSISKYLSLFPLLSYGDKDKHFEMEEVVLYRKKPACQNEILIDLLEGRVDGWLTGGLKLVDQAVLEELLNIEDLIPSVAKASFDEGAWISVH